MAGLRVQLGAGAIACALVFGAGCGGDDGDADADDLAVDAGIDTERDLLASRLREIDVPAFNLDRAIDRWEHFVTEYAGRVVDTEQNQRAADYLTLALDAAGYSIRRIEYQTPDGKVNVIEGTLPGGDDAGRTMALVAHYDVVPATVQGAYDNGAGVAVQLQLCELLANVPLDKTLKCVFFDGEEIGRAGSVRYVNEVTSADADDATFGYDMVFGFDMVGLGWPGYTDWKQYVLAGLDTPELEPYLAANVAFLDAIIMQHLGDRLGIVPEGVEIKDIHYRNSDEKTFKEAGIPALRFIGGENFFDYDAYHTADDTVDTVYALAGGRAQFAAGFEMTVWIAYFAVRAYDRYDPLALPDLDAAL